MRRLNVKMAVHRTSEHRSAEHKAAEKLRQRQKTFGKIGNLPKMDLPAIISNGPWIVLKKGAKVERLPAFSPRPQITKMWSDTVTRVDVFVVVCSNKLVVGVIWCGLQIRWENASLCAVSHKFFSQLLCFKWICLFLPCVFYSEVMDCDDRNQ